jgi:hypothetical protein
MKTYQYFSVGFGCNVQVTYKDGIIYTVELEDSTLDVNSIEADNEKCWFFIYEKGFLSATKGKTKVTEINREVTFDMFWDKYDYKISGKEEAKRAWKKLSKLDQLLAFDYIKQYEGQLKLNPVSKLYASTYLNAKRWIR